MICGRHCHCLWPSLLNPLDIIHHLMCLYQLQVYGQQRIVHLCRENPSRGPVSEKTRRRYDGSCIGAEKETRQRQKKDAKTTVILILTFVQLGFCFVIPSVNGYALCRQFVILIPKKCTWTGLDILES